MDEIFEQLKSLQNSHPSRVKLYRGASISEIESFEHDTSMKLDPSLRELYLLTNGFSVMDYCLLGLGNKYIADFFDFNSEEILKASGSRKFHFVVTSGDEYYYFYGNETNVFFGDDTEDDAIVSESFYEFFEKFVKASEKLLNQIPESEIVEYFENPLLP